MASQFYTNFKSLTAKGSVAPLTDTIKIALLKSTYTPNIDTDVFFSDIIANESSGTGYTSGGITLSGITETNDTTNHRGIITAPTATFTAVTFTDARYAVIYKSTGVNSTSPLMELVDLVSTQTSSGGNFSVIWNATGTYAVS